MTGGRWQDRSGKALHIFLEDDVMEQLRSLAEANGRSLTDEGSHAILRHLAAPPRLITPQELPEVAPRPSRKKGRPKKEK